jgi:hypothetical protein
VLNLASDTTNLLLHKKDPLVDGEQTFNIETMLNQNWDKIDQFAGEVEQQLANVDDLDQAVNDLILDVGNLVELDTETKANLVAAINEVYQKLAAHLADDTKHITATERTTWNAKQSALQTNQVRHIFIDTVDPISTDGVDGDIWIKYKV